MFGLTPEGEKNYALVDSYGLSGYYQYEVGNIIIHDFEMPSVIDKVLVFISENDWILGHEEDYYYVTNAADFKNW